MICFPNAKINLGLHIIGKRPDGYHNIETIFYPVGIRDALEIVPAAGEKGIFKQTGIPVDGNPDDNLVLKAYRLLKDTYNLPEMDIYLRKNIPFGAGLGGGSADAAFILKLVNNYAKLDLTDRELEDLVAQLGADCPFFIQNRPVFAEGTGNIFTPIELLLGAYHLILIKPDIHVSTKDAYARVHPHKPEYILTDIIQQPIHSWKECLVNDFEASVFAQYPEIRNIKEQLYNSGAVYASMSGSGSAVFGLFDSPQNLKDTFPTHQVIEIQ